MRKIIAVMKDHQNLAEIAETVGAANIRFRQRHDFLEEQLRKLGEERAAAAKEFWKSVESICAAKNLFPDDHSSKKHHLEYDQDLGLIVACDCSRQSPFAGLVELLNR